MVVSGRAQEIICGIVLLGVPLRVQVVHVSKEMCVVRPHTGCTRICVHEFRERSLELVYGVFTQPVGPVVATHECDVREPVFDVLAKYLEALLLPFVRFLGLQNYTAGAVALLVHIIEEQREEYVGIHILNLILHNAMTQDWYASSVETQAYVKHSHTQVILTFDADLLAFSRKPYQPHPPLSRTQVTK